MCVAQHRSYAPLPVVSTPHAHSRYGNVIAAPHPSPVRPNTYIQSPLPAPIEVPRPLQSESSHGFTDPCVPIATRTPSSSSSSEAQASLQGSKTGAPRQSLSLDKSAQNKRRREQRSYEPAFFKETVASHAEGRKPKYPIPTNEQGKIIGLRTKWHSTCKSIARRLINWSYQSYAKRHSEWQLLILTLQRELDSIYTYNPTGLDPGYLSKYLEDALAHWKSTWRQFYYETGRQHEDCPDEAWAAWQPHWNSEEGRQKSKEMQEKRALGAQSSGSGGTGDSLLPKTPPPDMYPVFTYSPSEEVRPFSLRCKLCCSTYLSMAQLIDFGPHYRPDAMAP